MERETYQEGFTSFARPQGREAETQAITQTANAVGGLVVQHIDKQNQAKIFNYASQADMDIYAKTEAWKTKHSDNPNDITAVDELNKIYDSAFAGYDSKFGITGKKEWRNARDTLKQKYMKETQRWAVGQQAKNYERNLNEGKTNYLNNARNYGRMGADTMALEDLNMQIGALGESLSGVLPQSTIAAEIGNFEADSLSSFILGRIETDPEQALALLEAKTVVTTLNDIKKVEDLRKTAETQIKRNQADVVTAQANNNKAFVERALSPMSPTERVDFIREIEVANLDGSIDTTHFNKLKNFVNVDSFATRDDVDTATILNNMINGQIKTDNGEEFSDTEIETFAMENAGKLSENTVNNLADTIQKNRDVAVKNKIKTSTDHLNGVALEFLANNMTVESMTGVARGQVTQAMATVAEILQTAKTPQEIEQLKIRLAEEMKDFSKEKTKVTEDLIANMQSVLIDYNKQAVSVATDKEAFKELDIATQTRIYKSIDKTYSPQKHGDKVEAFPVGTRIVNNFGETKVLNSNGEWVAE